MRPSAILLARRPGRYRAALAALAAALVLAGCGDEREGEQASVPPGFFGVVAETTITDAELERMQAGGVGSFHLLISWPRIETAPGNYDFSLYDDLITKLARAGIEPLPYVFGTPSLYAEQTIEPPVDSREAREAWRAFLGELVARYGPDGELWRELARREPGLEPAPLRRWEIWNEPNAPAFWAPAPDPGDYARLLGDAEEAIHAVDPTAAIMVAGMFATPSAEGAIVSFDFLRRLLEQPGAVELFDDVGIHPYGPGIGAVRRQLDRTREALDAGGAADAGLWITELGWGSDPTTPSQLAKTPERQAELLREALAGLAAERERWRLETVLWYAWRDPAPGRAPCGWCASAGLFDADLDPKPSWTAYAELAGGEP